MENDRKVKITNTSHRFCSYKDLMGKVLPVYKGTIHYYHKRKDGTILPLLRRDCKLVKT